MPEIRFQKNNEFRQNDNVCPSDEPLPAAQAARPDLITLTLVETDMRSAYLRLPLKKDGKKCPKEPGEIGRRTVYVLVNARFTRFELQYFFLHG